MAGGVVQHSARAGEGTVVRQVQVPSQADLKMPLQLLNAAQPHRRVHTRLIQRIWRRATSAGVQMQTQHAAPCSGARASRLLSLACHKREAAWLYMHLKMKEQGSLRSWTAIQARGTKATGLARHALAKPAAIGQGMERLSRGSTERLGV